MEIPARSVNATGVSTGRRKFFLPVMASLTIPANPPAPAPISNPAGPPATPPIKAPVPDPPPINAPFRVLWFRVSRATAEVRISYARPASRNESKLRPITARPLNLPDALDSKTCPSKPVPAGTMTAPFTRIGFVRVAENRSPARLCFVSSVSSKARWSTVRVGIQMGCGLPAAGWSKAVRRLNGLGVAGEACCETDVPVEFCPPTSPSLAGTACGCISATG
jgi:hypothetical protein